MKDYNQKAIEYAERYGIIKYKVTKNEMVYREEIKREGIYKATVNLDTMKETRKKLYERGWKPPSFSKKK